MATATSTTATAPAVSASTLNVVLADYDLHRSEAPSSAAQHSPPPPPAANNPQDWLADHRRVPPHRPVNTNLDPEERIVFQSLPEQLFIRTMFFGIRVVTVFHRTWRMTGEKVSQKTFEYDLGGEY